MTEAEKNDALVFGLDIGTRSIVGIVGYKNNDTFNVIGHYFLEHETRAMIDGQIHDINKVAETVKTVKEKLEEQINKPLKNVCIAAAGRVLKTASVLTQIEFDTETLITEDHIYSLELKGVEKAHKEVSHTYNDTKYHCVGYSVVKYYLNDYIMVNLLDHKAKKIAAEVLATFLPQEVIDSLYAVIDKVGLTVSNLTLEPIAAINVAIPEQYRLLNIALVDVGAGTSDIAITREGSVIAYGMIPYAGDKITEQLVHKYLVDFKTAEKMKLDLDKKETITFKDIMGIVHKCEYEEILEAISPVIIEMSKAIALKIKELNGNKATNAVFCVGGGGQVHSFTQLLSEELALQQERVALRGSEVLDSVTMHKKGVKKEPSLVTPVGIALSAYYQNSHFIKVYVNDTPVKIYNNNKLTVIDVAVHIGFDHKHLFPKKGEPLKFQLNDQKVTIKGQIGEPAKILLNEKEVSINAPIKQDDKIQIIEATKGCKPSISINDLKEYESSILFYVNNQKISCPRLIKVNEDYVDAQYTIKNNDRIMIQDYYSLEDLLKYMDLDIDYDDITINDTKAKKDSLIFAGNVVKWNEKKKVKTIDDILSEDLEVATKKNNLADEPLTMGKHKYNHINVQVNGEYITLQNKSEYMFVDIFDHIDFDLKTPKGKLITKINNHDNIAYTQRLFDGDIIELYWEGKNNG
ncbi:cell division protein FtsA [Natranaerovirga hydrolytica]|uniref:Cell division protein FtsA n=1 Tax=Natranaerovirga hydrolytica TaxID=680378 RepID=A0A4R1N003_9FIRM|nr:pilus assembly protein PilM [Natranaerovirga hydrolytica]TCK98200.1 cell division protein FtsA [Natranaerovirga hydrolytica]